MSTESSVRLLQYNLTNYFLLFRQQNISSYKPIKKKSNLYAKFIVFIIKNKLLHRCIDTIVKKCRS